MPVDVRAAWLAEFCGDDEKLRAEIESLLSVQTKAEKFLEKSAGEYAAKILPAENLNIAGKIFGRYRILKEIGRGGMGAVYLAERTDGEFEQQVALKIVRQTIFDTESEKRFRRERQILASLNHPNIARLLDGGVSEMGEPFLAMEHIAGEPLMEYVEKQTTSLDERLRLFLKICLAVAFAHRNLIVHRDIKPSNILVTTEGEPKLLDFGLAKILNEARPDQDETASIYRAMTPAYASPEQISGENVTTSSDIYSLGIVLYEIIKSSRFAERTANYLNQKPKNDLDAILLTALEHEPERRYKSVEQFAEDIERFLHKKPVKARPNTFSYRAAKFVRRNRYGVAAAGLILLVLIAGVSATLWQSRRAEQQRALAARRFSDVRRLANSFLFEITPQIENIEGTTKARETIVRRALEYLDSLAKESADDRELQRELAAAYEKVGEVQGLPNQPNLGDTRGALDSFQKALALRSTLASVELQNAGWQDELAATYEQIAYIQWWTSDTRGAVENYQKSLAIREKLVAENPQNFDLQKKLANVRIYYGDIPAWNEEADEALKQYRAAQAVFEKLAAESPNDSSLKEALGRTQMRVADALKIKGDYDSAIRAADAALAAYEPLLPERGRDNALQHKIWTARFRKCEAVLLKEDKPAALEVCGALLPLAQKMSTADPDDSQARHKIGTSFYELAEALQLNQKYAEAIENYRRALANTTALAAAEPENSEHPRMIAVNRLAISRAERHLNNFADALENSLAARDILEKQMLADEENTVLQFDWATAERELGEINIGLKKPSEAKNHFERSLGKMLSLQQNKRVSEANAKLIEEVKAKIAQCETLSARL